MIELITKDSKDLILHNTVAQATVTIGSRGFYFSKAASLLYELKKGNYIHFGRSKNEKGKYTGCWYFIVNNDSSGMNIAKSTHDATVVCNRPLMRLFMQDVKCILGDMFYLQETESELNNCPVVEILVNKSVRELLKDNY